MTRTSEPIPGVPPREAPLEKQEIRLPDGRALTFYRFPEAQPPAPAAPARPTGKER